MKIAFLIVDVSVGRGGERVSTTIANALSKLYDVEILTLYHQQPEPFFKIDQKVKVKVLMPSGRVASTIVTKLTGKFLELKNLRDHLSKHNYDMLIGVGSYPSILLGMMASLLFPSLTAVAWEHSNFNALDTFWKRVRRVFYPKLKSIICLNHKDAEEFSKHFNNVRVISNPLSFRTETVASLDNKKIISAGAFETEKGFDLLIQAFKRLGNIANDWNLVLVGEGSLKYGLVKQVKESGLTGRIEFKEPVRDIRSELLNSSLYVMPSRREGFGMVLIEAMECGVPCISFDCPTGPSTIITNNKNGILVPPENAEALANSIVALINDREKMISIAAAGKLSVEKYYLENIVGHWKALISNFTRRQLTNN